MLTIDEQSQTGDRFGWTMGDSLDLQPDNLSTFGAAQTALRMKGVFFWDNACKVKFEAQFGRFHL